MVSVPVVPKLNPNHVGIGSRTERLRVLKRRKLKNSLRFSFLSLVTRWSKLDQSETSVVFSLFLSVLGYELILSLCKFILNT